MAEQKYNFSGSRLFENLLLVLGVICLGASLLLFFNILSHHVQVLSLPLFLISANFFIGAAVARKSMIEDYAALPFVDLFSTDHDLILDAGCGSGRTTVEVSKVLKKGQIVALDMFASRTQEDISSRDLLEKNLKIAGITDRVRIVKGDVTKLEFKDNTFDSIVTTLLLNNLGKAKLAGLKELHRVLKPGGKMLVVVPVPSIFSFAVMSVLAFMLDSREKWRALFPQAGFRILQEGVINFGVFYFLQK